MIRGIHRLLLVLWAGWGLLHVVAWSIGTTKDIDGFETVFGWPGIIYVVLMGITLALRWVGRGFRAAK